MGCTDNFSSHPRDVHIYDARCLNSRRSQPLLSLAEHTKSIASAYFSPVTGNRVVTTCADCKLRYSKKTEPCFLGNLETAAMVFATRSFVYCCCYGITSITVHYSSSSPLSISIPSLPPHPSLFLSQVSLYSRLTLNLPSFCFGLWSTGIIGFTKSVRRSSAPGESGIHFKSVLNGNCSAPDFGQKIMLLPKLIGVVLGFYLWYRSIATLKLV